MKTTVDKTYKVGDTVRYETFTGELRTVKVTEKLDEVKNGRAGFSGVETQPHIKPHLNVWGYNSQILRVYCQEQKRWKM